MKRLIAFLISITMLTALVPLTASAANADTYDETYENAKKLVSAINTAYSLDKADPSAPVSRGDFLRLALGLYGMNFARAEHSFTDVDTDLAPFVTHALDTGMIESGVKFYPDTAVTYDMATRVAVVMSGYTPMVLSGGSYAYAANSAKLFAGVEGSDITVRNAVVLLANVLTTRVMEQSVFGPDNAEYKVSDETFLEMYHDVVWCEGIVKANQYTSLTSATGACADGHIMIGLEEFECSEPEFLGYNVRAYYKKDSRTVVAIHKSENIEVAMNEVRPLSGTRVEGYTTSDDESRITLDESYLFIYNGKAYMHAGYENLLNFDFGEAVFVDNNGDSKFDVVFVWEYSFMSVDYADNYNMRVFDKNNDAWIDLSASDCYYEVYYKYKYAMEKAEFDDIADGASLTYCLSKDGKYCRFYITEENVTGMISEINTEHRLVKIGDNYYKYNDYFEKYYPDYLGKTSTYYFAYDGTLLSAGSAMSTSGKYGWLSKVGQIANGLQNELYIRIYTEDGTLSDFVTAEKVVLDGDPKDRAAVKAALDSYISGGDVYDRVIKFKVNDEGLVSHIDRAVDAAGAADIRARKDDDNSLTRYYKDEYAYRDAAKNFSQYFRVSDITKVFKIPYLEADRDKEKNYSVYSYSSYFSNDESYNVCAYDVSESGLAQCLVYSEVQESGSSGGNESAMMKLAALSTSGVYIGKRTVYFPEESEVKTVYDIYRAGGFRAYTAYDEIVEDYMKKASPGDILRINANANGEIIGVIWDFDISEQEMVYPTSGDNKTDVNRVTYYSGYLDRFDGTYMNLVTDLTAETMDDVSVDEYYNLNTGRDYQIHVLATKDSNGDVVKVELNDIDADSLVTFSNAGKDASFVVVRRRNQNGQLAVVYTFVTK